MAWLLSHWYAVYILIEIDGQVKHENELLAENIVHMIFLHTPLWTERDV